jgi:hypothetical protein
LLPIQKVQSFHQQFIIFHLVAAYTLVQLYYLHFFIQLVAAYTFVQLYYLQFFIQLIAAYTFVQLYY